MTKKGSSDILADENREIFREKVKFVTFSRVLQFFENRGEISNRGGNASWPHGVMDTPEQQQ